MSKLIDSIVLFRQDLRLFDNPALYQACQKGTVLPVFVLDALQKPPYLGQASFWWLGQSLQSLNHSLGGKLNVFEGHTQAVLLDLTKRYAIKKVYWNRRYQPDAIEIDGQLKNILIGLGVEVKSFNASLLWEPWTILKKDQTPYKVFTPFYRKGALSSAPPRQPLPKPENMKIVSVSERIQLSEYVHTQSAMWHNKLASYWQVGENGAQQMLSRFLEVGIEGYKEKRNYPSEHHTSRLSPYLQFGEISPHQVWYSESPFAHGEDDAHFKSELAWR